MTFDELMTKYENWVALAAENGPTLGDFRPPRETNPHYENLRAALAQELIDFGSNWPPNTLDRAAKMLADDLISRYLIQDGSGASFEGVFGGGGLSGDNPDIEYGADEPSPSLQVEVRRPPPGGRS